LLLFRRFLLFALVLIFLSAFISHLPILSITVYGNESSNAIVRVGGCVQ
jgi:hypothetical protein